jgi:competence protein ComEA
MQWTSDPGARLLAVLGLYGDRLRREEPRDGPGVGEEAAAGLDYWVPTLASRPADDLLPAPAPGRPDPLDPRPPVAASPFGRHRRTGRRRDRRPSPVETPASVRGARWEAGRPALVGLVVVIVSVAAVLGVRLLSARADARPRDLAPALTGTTPSAGAAGVTSRSRPVFGGASAAATTGAAGGTGRLRVHVVGRVRHPAVVVLAAGSRVEDAVRSAGGFAPGADQGAVNLARLLVDGEQIRIPVPGEAVVPADGSASRGTPGGGGGGGGGGKVSLNAADASALDSLPGVGEVLAGRILAWRQEHGRFSTVEELGEVSGIGEKLLTQLTPLVTL